MLPPMPALSAATKKGILVSFNRVIIVASGQISRVILIVVIKITSIDAKKEMQQDKQRKHPERVAAVAVAAVTVPQQAQMQQ